MIINISSISTFYLTIICGLNFYYISNTDRKYQPVRNENFFIGINMNTEPDFSIEFLNWGKETLKNLFTCTFKRYIYIYIIREIIYQHKIFLNMKINKNK